MRESRLRKYAELIVRKGINVRKGQEVLVIAGLDQPDFVLTLVEEAYKAGASRVSVQYEDDRMTALELRYMELDEMKKVADWEIERQKHRVNTLPCRIFLDSFDPDVLAGCDTVKLAGARQARAKVLKPYRDQMENKYQWCIAAVPGKAWAKKLFPELSEKKAVEKLWEYILKCSRADGRSPRAAWARHNSELARRCDYLNSLGLDSLHIKSGNGTDLTVGLIPGMQFMGGCESPLGKKLKFNPNIPSEEIFTSPDKARTEGVVYSTLPLSYNGKLIKSFSVRFENGKATEIKGSTDEETEILKTLIEMDEGACMLGETALVPYSSPIRESGVIYYNTLFDENAACHLALGMGFTNCMKDYEKFTQDELHGMGINDSIIHVDFMIGAADTEITGRTRDGRTVGIFKKGEWAFEV